ncbi:MAG: endopeptidase La [Proteobacteria bacterium]|nr:endopeptidase La [Pseudomonadota bacterium]MBQ9242681.1 endopeptidase La [Pseudomonadota bacterium]
MDSQDGKKRRSPQKILSEDLIKGLFEQDGNSDSDMNDVPILPLDDIVIYPTGLSVIKIAAREQVNSALSAMERSEHLVAMPVRPRTDEFPIRDLTDINSYYKTGTYTRILKILRVDNGEAWQLTLKGEKRVHPTNLMCDGPGSIPRMSLVEALEVPLAIIGEDVYTDQNLLRQVRQSARLYFERCRLINTDSKEIMRLIDQMTDPSALTDYLSVHVEMPYEQRVALLEELEISKRLRLLIDIIANHLEVAKLIASTAQKVRTDMDKQQREYFIRQHIKVLKEQIEDAPENDADELKAKVEALDADKEVKEYALKQVNRLVMLPQASAEYAVARTHIEAILDIPWRVLTEDNLSISDAARILDEDHYGLEKVKERILEHLSVLALRKDFKGAILCLYGPPGVGKTSITKSIARALGRKFERVSLGGIHDESEIRGHRRTYVGSMPGRIVQALRHAKTRNPVILLDEIDKLTSDIHGDPASALLEVLDPELNNAFVDNYIETPIDLSRVLFITTANSLDTIPGPLRDRMEIIELPSYTHIDKRHIGRDFLIPKAISEHGLKKSNLSITDDALDDLIAYHTREAGVRQLEQKIGAICRKVAARVVRGAEEGKKSVRVSIGRKNLETFVGKKKYDFDRIEKDRLPGISTGLAWTPAGGDILFIETTEVSGKGNLVITGKLGDVMQESARAALTLVRSRAEKLGLDPAWFSEHDIHLHVPAGAIPKDGPSAGTAIFCALLSLCKNKPIPSTLAMTGEISLRGNVLPVGGIREKVLAAHRAGIRTVLLPAQNERDLEEVDASVREELKFVPVTKIDDVIAYVFG